MENIKKLTILHSNDLHGDFLAEKIDEKLIGGVSMLSGYVGKVRNEEQNTIYCIAGDMFRGSVIDSRVSRYFHDRDYEYARSGCGYRWQSRDRLWNCSSSIP